MTRGSTMPGRTEPNMMHITAVLVAFEMMESCQYRSFNPVGHYDGGMNFLGLLGETQNTQPSLRGATIICSWLGSRSDPLPPDARSCSQPNLLYDFNGSGDHFQNNDPRHFLPYGSNGLVVDEVRVDSDEKLLEGWCAMRGRFFQNELILRFFGWWLLVMAKRHLRDLNQRCRSGKMILSIVRALP